MFATVLYNSVLTLITATAVWAVRRDGRPRACLVAVAAVGAASVVLAVGLSDGPFRGLRLLAYGIFAFSTLMLACCSVVLWRSHRRLCRALLRRLRIIGSGCGRRLSDRATLARSVASAAAVGKDSSARQSRHPRRSPNRRNRRLRALGDREDRGGEARPDFAGGRLHTRSACGSRGGDCKKSCGAF